MESDWTIAFLIKPFLIGITTILLIYWYTSKKQKYWKDLGIPYVTPLPLFGSVLDVFNKAFHVIEQERYKKYGKIYGFYEGNRPLLSVGDTSLLRNILVKDFQVFPGGRTFQSGDPIMDKVLFLLKGEEWKRIRSIVTPTFTTGKIKRMIGIFKDSAATCANNLRASAISGKPIDLKRVFGAFTMDVIASSAFSTKIDSHNDPNNKFVAMARKVFGQNISFRFILLVLYPRLQRFLRIGIFPQDSVDFFRETTLQILEERKKTGKVRNDFLQLLMDTAKETNTEEKQESPENEDITANYGDEEGVNAQLMKMVTKKTLSHNEMIAQCILFFLAGYESTAATASFAAYLLAINPEAQDRLAAEIEDALSYTDGELSYEALQKMKYLDNVISETLRMYSPAVRSERLAEEDYKLGDTGITIKKNMVVSIPIYAIHNDPKNFPNPEKFDPDRFNPEERAKRDQFAYMPFGAGPKNCVAMRFALMEIKVCLAHIFSHFRIKRCAQTKVPLEFNVGRQILQAKEVVVGIEERSGNIKAR